MDQNKLKSIIESLLFVGGEPLKLSKLAKISGAPKPEVENAIMILSGEYVSQHRGLLIIQKGEEVQLASSPENSHYIEQLVESELKGNLSQPSLEVLSIIAYRGPVARSAVEAIRGVNSSYTLRSLMMRGLIERTENPNDTRSDLYSLSFDFMKMLGIEKIEKMPDYENLSRDARIENLLGAQEASVVNEITEEK